MVVNRILRGKKKITSVLEFPSIRKFRNINFKNLVLWLALKSRTPGYNQGKEGKTAHKGGSHYNILPPGFSFFDSKAVSRIDFSTP